MPESTRREYYTIFAPYPCEPASLALVMTTRGAAAVIAGSATGAVGAIAVIAARTIEASGTGVTGATGTVGALAALALAGTCRSLGLVDAIEGDLAAIIDLEDLDLDLVADVEHVLDLVDAALGDAEICSRPSLPGSRDTKAPKGWMETTRPVYSLPGSGTLMMSWMRSTACSTESPVPPT